MRSLSSRRRSCKRAGPEPSFTTLVTQDLLPHREGREERVRIDGPTVMLEPNIAQTIAISLHELRPTQQNTDRYR